MGYLFMAVEERWKGTEISRSEENIEILVREGARMSEEFYIYSASICQVLAQFIITVYSTCGITVIHYLMTRIRSEAILSMCAWLCQPKTV